MARLNRNRLADTGDRPVASRGRSGWDGLGEEPWITRVTNTQHIARGQLLWHRELSPALYSHLEGWDELRAGGKFKKKGTLLVYFWLIALLYSRNQHNIVKQLSSNGKKMFKWKRIVVFLWSVFVCVYIFSYPQAIYTWPSLVAQMVKRLPTMRKTWVRSLGQEDPLEKEMATHSSILAWKIPWMEELGWLLSMGSQRVGHDWAIHYHYQIINICFIYWLICI